DRDTLWSLLEPIFRAGDTYAIEADISRDAALDYWTGGTHRAFLAEEGSTALGSYYLCPNQRGGGAHVSNAGFITSPAARGRGLARTMLHHAEAEARTHGFHAMQFNFVVATNKAALHIWKSEGYAQVGRLPLAFHHPTEGHVDAFVLFKLLEQH
ncbi:MAG: GNAT family N-acetyltransferase, partial [Pseudomonadota bacterium]